MSSSIRLRWQGSPRRPARLRERAGQTNTSHGTGWTASQDQSLRFPSPPRIRQETPLAHEPQSDFWEAPGGSSDFFSPPLMKQTLAPGENILTLLDQPSNPS